MSVAVMMQRIAGASPRFRARMAGVLYLLSVVAAACTELFLRGRLNVAGGLVANAGMAAVTLILYTIFKPVNKRLALLAAFFNFVGLAFEALRLNPRGVDVALVFTAILLPPDRLPHVQVDFSTSNSGRADGVCRFGLADLSVKSAGKLSVPLQSGLRPPRGSIRVPVAARDGCERSEMARESNFGELAEPRRLHASASNAATITSSVISSGV